MADKYLSTRDAAALIGVSQPHIRALAQEGKITWERFGNVLMIDCVALLAYKKSMDEWRATRHNSERAKARRKTKAK